MGPEHVNCGSIKTKYPEVFGNCRQEHCNQMFTQICLRNYIGSFQTFGNHDYPHIYNIYSIKY